MSYVLSRVAAVALVALVGVMAGFAIWQGQVADDRLAEVERSEQIAATYGRADRAILLMEREIGIYTATQDPQSLLTMTLQQKAFETAMADLMAIGDDDDRLFAETMQSHAVEYGALFERLFMLGPDAAAALAPDFQVAGEHFLESILAGKFGDPEELLAQLRREQPGATLESLIRTSNPVALVAGPRAQMEWDRSIQLAADMREANKDSNAIAVGFYGVLGVLALSLVVVIFIFGRREAKSRAAIEQLRQTVTTDPLTGLGNRRGFEEQVQALAEQGNTEFALVMMDLDEFKEVNDTFGHDRGDLILRSFSKLMLRDAPHGALHFRIGGDEFAMVLPKHTAEEALAVTERIRASALEANLNGVTLSAGVALLGDEARDHTLLRQQADAALYEAKLRGRNLVVLYHDDSHAVPVFPAAKLAAVRELLVEGRLEAHFQPIWNMHTRTLLGYEALARPHADYGLAGPQQAFDIAEKFGRASDLDFLCRQHILAKASVLPAGLIFINLSPYSLTHQSFSPLGLVKEVKAAGLSPSQVVLEITERSIVAPEAIAEAVRNLRNCGFSVALDDVGAGNNGLEMLRKVPFEFVKVDRGVMLSASASGKGRGALMAILAFAAEASARVVAEGIEDVPMFDLVREVAQSAVKGNPGLIHGVQGYLFGRPAPAEQVTVDAPDALVA